MKTQETNDKTRKDAAYPYYDLETCIKFASNIKALGGSKGGIKKSQLAQQVGLAESTPSFFQRLSACKTFGIIDGWGEYALTEIGRKHFYPQSEHDVKTALLAMFMKPSAFEFIVKRFDGEKLPATGIMGNIFHQELSVPDSWKDRVAQIFTRSAYFAEIIDSGGFLRYDAAVHNKPTSTAEPKENPPESLAKPTAYKSLPIDLIPTDNAPPGITVWSYSHKGSQIKVQTPELISKELWGKLNAYVQILKPENGE
jgi:hypothetical protein